MQTLNTLRIAGVAAAALALVGSASAQASMSSWTNQWLKPSNQNDFDSFNSSSADITFNQRLENADGVSEVNLLNSFGLIRSRAFAESNDAQNGIITSQVNSAQSDRFTIDAEGLTGTRGTFAVTVALTGEFEHVFGGQNGGAVFGEFDLDLDLQYEDGEAEGGWSYAGGIAKRGELEINNTGTIRQGDDFGTYSFDVDFIYGTPIEMSMELFTEAEASFTTGYMDTDLSHTFRWAGISDLQDANGNSVLNYTQSSDSGFNYAQPVPEPGTMIALGAGAIALLRRRSKK